MPITDITQCDTALIEKLSGLKVDDGQGNMIDVPVVYIDPEVEFVASVLPTIAVYRAGIYPDPYRWTNDKFYDNPVYDENGELVSVNEREAPDPYTIYYGIRIFYEYQIDGALVNKHLLTKLRRGAYLSIGGDLYDVLFVSYKNPEATYRTFGELKENEQREFYEQFLYKVQIELDNATRAEVKVSKDLVTQVTTIP